MWVHMLGFDEMIELQENFLYVIRNRMLYLRGLNTQIDFVHFESMNNLANGLALGIIPVALFLRETKEILDCEDRQIPERILISWLAALREGKTYSRRLHDYIQTGDISFLQPTK